MRYQFIQSYSGAEMKKGYRGSYDFLGSLIRWCKIHPAEVWMCGGEADRRKAGVDECGCRKGLKEEGTK
jgi:hypothetical protein